jgi:integrase
LGDEVIRRPLGQVRWREARGLYEIRYYPEVGGKRAYASYPGPRSDKANRAAQLRLAELLSAAGRGEKPANRMMSVGKWLDEWLGGVGNLTPESLRAYEDRIELYIKPALGRKRLADLTAPMIVKAFGRLMAPDYVGARGKPLSVGTIDAAFRVLHAALEGAVDEDLLPRNPARGARMPRPRVQVRPPTIGELDRLFVAIGPHPWRAIYSVMRWTGARHGEVLGLEWVNVDQRAGTLTFLRQDSGELKTATSQRTVVPPPAVMAEVLAMPQRGELVFATATGRAISERNVLRTFDRAIAAAGIAPTGGTLAKYRPHDLRHAFATMLLEAGVGLGIVAEKLGHGSTRMLDRYRHVRTKPGQEAYQRMLAEWGPEGLLEAFALRPTGRWPEEVREARQLVGAV